MQNPKEYFKSKLFGLTTHTFDAFALEVFRYQAQYNPIYALYLQYLGCNPARINTITEIPFLPIEFFKTHQVCTGSFEVEEVFESSGTTAMQRSKHYVGDTALYKKVSEHIFRQFYGELEAYTLFALLPSYLEREGSSLVYMVNHFLSKTDASSGFFLHDIEALMQAIENARSQNKKIIVMGVSFALLDFAEKYQNKMPEIIVMETGGMKGRRKEMIREELHAILGEAWGTKQIHSEYGMTELLSQCYAKQNGVFEMPPWVRILLRDIYDPFDITTQRRNGGINVIDLANIDSCCFVETKDIGSMDNENTFSVLGRFDNTDIRGCNLLAL